MVSPFIVRFIRIDNKPIEEYYYNSVEEAIAHYNLFLNDDSGLYSKIEIVSYDGEVIKCLLI